MQPQLHQSDSCCGIYQGGAEVNYHLAEAIKEAHECTIQTKYHRGKLNLSKWSC